MAACGQFLVLVAQGSALIVTSFFAVISALVLHPITIQGPQNHWLCCDLLGVTVGAPLACVVFNSELKLALLPFAFQIQVQFRIQLLRLCFLFFLIQYL